MGNKASKQRKSNKNKKATTESNASNATYQNHKSPISKSIKSVPNSHNQQSQPQPSQSPMKMNKTKLLQELKTKKQPSKEITTQIRTKDGKIFTETIHTDGTISRKLCGQAALPQPLSPADPQTMPLQSYIYSENQWIPIQHDMTNSKNENKTDLSEQKTNQITELTIVSYNIWFANYKFDERQKKLLSMLRQIEPDIFCFQEVTPRFLKGFCGDTYIQNNFELSDSSNNIECSTVMPYGVMIGVNRNKNKLSMKELKICALTSNMGRKLVSSNVELGDGENIWINTVHLESLNNGDVRKDQLQNIFQIYMKDQTEAMLMGDFNFGDYTNENGYISNDVVDCWKEYKKILINNNETEDKKLLQGNTGFGTRFDRMLLRSDQWIVKQFEIVGEANMPSDHLGIITKLVAK